MSLRLTPQLRSMSVTSQLRTLFAPYAMTFDPDTANSRWVGWPVREAQVQQQGFNTVNAGQPGCIEYRVAGSLNFAHTVTSNGFARYYPAGVEPGAGSIDDHIEFYSFRYPGRVFLF